MDERVIDIGRYLKGSDPTRKLGAFSVWDGGNDRSRFALPVWRAIYLAGGDWGAIIRHDLSEDGANPKPFFILDLRDDRARTDCPTEGLRELEEARVPSLALTRDGGLSVLLGREGSGLWCLQVQGRQERSDLEDEERETLLFLAGECAGLLFFRKLATPSPSSSSAP